MGFTDRPLTAAQSQAIIDYFKAGAPVAEQVTLLGGVPADWRTLSGDSRAEAAFATVYRSFDVLSPWTVGRYIDAASADAYKTSHIVPDLAAAQAAGVDYLPVVFPGFSSTARCSTRSMKAPPCSRWHRTPPANRLRVHTCRSTGAVQRLVVG